MENTPIKIKEFKLKGKVYQLNEPLILKQKRDRESGFLYYAEEVFGLFTLESDLEKVKQDIMMQFIAIYHFYTKKEDRQLTPQAQQLKVELLRRVKEVSVH